jgi:murein DD-endopeptidase MepM/ murein hydrolase activator NlpD
VHRPRAGKAAAPYSSRSGPLASLLMLVVAGCLVPGSIAPGEPRRGVGADPGARPPVLASGRAALGDDGVRVRRLVREGETFTGILGQQGLPRTEIRAWEQAAAGVYDLDALRPGHALTFTLARDQGRLTACDYEIDRYALLTMRLVHGQIRARLKAMPQLAAVRGLAGKVEASLATTATAIGVPARVLADLSELFGWQVDLATDVRPGDEFRILYAELRDGSDDAPRPGDILAAEITSGGRRLTAIRFENERGEREYYDLDGRVLGRRFLRSPVASGRITSSYSGSRLHPVLKRRRPHRGVDFSAPIGTPVRAVASGVVTFAGRNGQYGNHVGIEHDAAYATSYSHLQRIAGGVRHGGRVRKGQVIGYVGRSGMATGPHLHFMLFENGRYVNPLTAKLAADERLAGPRRRRFAGIRDELLARLAELGPPSQVALAPRSLSELIRSKVASYVN